MRPRRKDSNSIKAEAEARQRVAAQRRRKRAVPLSLAKIAHVRFVSSLDEPGDGAWEVLASEYAPMSAEPWVSLPLVGSATHENVRDFLRGTQLGFTHVKFVQGRNNVMEM